MTKELVKIDGQVMELKEAILYLAEKNRSLTSKLNKLLRDDEDYMFNLVEEIELLI